MVNKEEIIEEAKDSISVQNISVSGSLCELFIEKIAMKDRFFTKPITTIPALRARFPTVTYLIFPSGSFILGGAVNTDEVQNTLDELVERLEDLGYEPEPEWEVQNMVFSGELPCMIDKDVIEDMENPEPLVLHADKDIPRENKRGKIAYSMNFPGIMVYSEGEKNQTVTLFKSGAFNINGIKEKSAEKGLEMAKKVLEYAVDRLPEEAFKEEDSN